MSLAVRTGHCYSYDTHTVTHGEMERNRRVRVVLNSRRQRARRDWHATRAR